MKFSRTIIIAIFALLVVFTNDAFARGEQLSASDISSIDVSKLSPDQRAALLASVAKMVNSPTDAADISQTVRNETSKWVDLGTNVGAAAVSAAKQVGMAANDFVKTPLGKVTMGIVIYKVICKMPNLPSRIAS